MRHSNTLKHNRTLWLRIATIVLIVSLQSGCIALNNPSTSVATVNVPAAAAGTSRWTTPGISDYGILSAAVHGTKMYTAGYATYHGSPNAEGVAIINPATGLAASGVRWPKFYRTLINQPFIASSFQATTGLIYAAIADPTEAGAFFVGGNFSYVDGVAKTNLARIKPDGTLDASWATVTNGIVYDIATDGTSLFVAGAFSNATDTMGTHSSDKIIKIDAASGLIQTAFTAVIAGTTAYAVALFPGGRVALGGDMSACGGACTDYFVINQTTGAVTADGGAGADGTVHTIEATAAMMFVGGSFSDIMGNPALYLAAIDATNPAVFLGALDTDGAVSDLHSDGTHCYVAGEFTDLAGTPAQSVGRVLLATGVVDATWAPVLKTIYGGNNPNIGAIYADATRVYFAVAPAYNLSYVNGDIRIAVAAVDKVTGTTTDAINLNAGASMQQPAVTVFAESGTNMLLGGGITSFGGIGRPTLAEIDLTTGLPTSWSPVLNVSFVPRVAVGGDFLYITGNFTTVDGQARPGAAAFDLSGPTPVLTAWDPSPLAGGTIYEIQANSTRAFVYGTYATIGGVARTRLSSFDHGSSVPNNWAPNANGLLVSHIQRDGLIVYEDSVYILGDYSLVNGTARRDAAEVDTNTGALLPWNPNINAGAGARITSVVRAGTSVIIEGSFTTINGGTPRTVIAATNATTGADLGWTPTPDNSTVIYLSTVGDHLYVGGRFNNISGNARAGIAQYNVSDLSLTSWNHSLLMYGGVKVMSVDGDPEDSIYTLGFLYTDVTDSSLPSFSAGISRFSPVDGTWYAPQ